MKMKIFGEKKEVLGSIMRIKSCCNFARKKRGRPARRWQKRSAGCMERISKQM